MWLINRLQFFVRLLITLCIYTLCLNLIEKIEAQYSTTTLLSAFIIVIFTGVIISIIKNSGHSYSFYGVRFDNAWYNIKEAIGYSIPVMLTVVLIKWLVINLVPGFQDFKLFDSTANFTTVDNFTYQKYFLFMFLYALFCPIQEFIVRGCIQTSMQELMDGHSGWGLVKVVLLSNLIFASVHSHTSTDFALLAFIPGLFCGWLYARQKNLVGVSVSHILIGLWSAFIVGFQNMV